MIAANPFKQSPHRKGLPLDLDRAGIKLRDVEQRRKQSVHRDGRFLNLFDQPLSLQRHHDAAQSADKQSKRMNRLSQIMARRREECRFGRARALGDLLLSLQIGGQLFGLDAQLDQLFKGTIGDDGQTGSWPE